MIIEQEHEDVLIGGAQNVKEFTIKASAKAFQILSSNLYSNPLGSMIRELSTNAYDAHIMVDNKEEPFTIKLPNSLDPTFKIRDFGPGLTPDEIDSVYTTFFESTKTNSNDVVGCLGLGSKSPFGVSDSFTIISFKDGTKTIYSAFLNDQRIPSVAKFHEEPTDERNGIEIEIAIKAEDINTFAREVNEQLKYFKVKPIVTGNSNFEWELQEEYIYEGTKWKMVSNNSRYNEPRVVQGQIAYPISIRDMGSKYDNASRLVQAILDMNILFEVNIGDVNIAPSREALSYDEATVENILSRAELIANELPTMISESLNTEKTEWEARLKYQAIQSTLGNSHSAINEYLRESGAVLWKNKDVSDMNIVIPEEYIKEFRFFDRTYKGNYRKNINHKQRDYENSTSDKSVYCWNVRVSKPKTILYFYATPEDKSIDGRVKQYITDLPEANPNPYIIVSEKSYRALKSKMGNPTLIKVSDLDKVRRNTKVKDPNASKKYNITTCYTAGWNKSDHWPSVEMEGDISELEGFYIEIDRHDGLYNGRIIDSTIEIVKVARNLKIIDDSKDMIYGLRKLNAKKNHNLVCLFTYIKEQYPKMVKHLKYDFTYSQVLNKIKTEASLIETLITDLNPGSPMLPIVEAMKHNNNLNISHHEDLMLKILEINVSLIDMKKETVGLDEKYSLISSLGYYAKSYEFVKYINQMDALEKLQETDIDIVSGYIMENSPKEKDIVEQE